MATSTMLEQPVAFKPGLHPVDPQREVTTENSNPTSVGFDTKSALEIARIINHEDGKIAAAVKKALPEIAIVMSFSVRKMVRSGRCVSSMSCINTGSR